MIPPGFAGHVNLTIPAATLIARADRPGGDPARHLHRARLPTARGQMRFRAQRSV
jgi:hypothetical protein